MKKILLFMGMVGFISTSLFSQINKSGTIKKKVEPAKTEPAPRPAPAPASTPAVTPVYSLRAVRVSIRTGNDNKEFPSNIYIDLWQKGKPVNDYAKYCLFKIHNLKNEMKVNSTTELGLEMYTGNTDKFLLSNIQQFGLELSLGYNPNFFMDAWRIEGISCVLEFRDQNGNLHPTLGSKTISFSNAAGYLNNDYHNMKCLIDQNLNGLSASIEK